MIEYMKFWIAKDLWEFAMAVVVLTICVVVVAVVQHRETK